MSNVQHMAVMAAAVLALQVPATGTRGSGLAGTWHGTSTCVDTRHFPACRNEIVIYTARPREPGGDALVIAADKLVHGVRQPMGELDYTRQPDGSWMADFRNARVHVRIVLHVANDHVTGTMSDVPSGRRVREIVLDRTQ